MFGVSKEKKVQQGGVMASRQTLYSAPHSRCERLKGSKNTTLVHLYQPDSFYNLTVVF